MEDSFNSRWKQWLQRPPAFRAFNTGNQSAPAYGVEGALDHVRTSVLGIVRGIGEGRDWPFRSQIQQELANLQLAETLLDSAEVQPAHRSDLLAWIAATREILLSLDAKLQAETEELTRFPELSRHTAPSLVAQVLRDLIDGRTSRSEVAEWASFYVRAYDPAPVVDSVWEAVVRLSGADSPSTDREFLYTREDFEDWLRDLESSQ